MKQKEFSGNRTCLRYLKLLAMVCLFAVVVSSFACSKAVPTQPSAPSPQPAVATPTPATPAPAPATPTPTPTARPTTPAPPPTPPPTPAALEVPITVKNSSNLGSLQLELRYDAQALELQSVKAGPLARNALVDSNKSAPGVVKIGLVSTSGISGDGAVITLTFIPLGKGGPNNLNVFNIDAADTDLRDLVVSAIPGQFSGGSGQVTGPVLSFRK